MPATLPTPNLNSATNYPPELARQLQALYAQGSAVLTIPTLFSLADAAVLFTVPAGVRLSIGRSFHEVLVSFTGGASSAVGLSSSNTNYSTKGDLLGGASGDVAAVMISTGNPFKGTVGAKAATQGLIILNAADTIRWDLVTSQFTAGSGLVHIPCTLIPAS